MYKTPPGGEGGLLPAQGLVLLIWIIVGQWPTALAVGAGGVVWIFFSLVYSLFYLTLSGRRPDQLLSLFQKLNLSLFSVFNCSAVFIHIFC